MRIPLFMFYSKFSCARHAKPKLAILTDFAEGCSKRKQIITKISYMQNTSATLSEKKNTTEAHNDRIKQLLIKLAPLMQNNINLSWPNTFTLKRKISQI